MADSWRTRLLLAAVGAASVAVLARLAIVSAGQLAAPFDLVHETPNLASIQLLQQGLPLYGAYDRPPFVLTLYTPLYSLLGAALPSGGENPFFWGRALSLLCMTLAGLLPFALARGRGSWAVPALAAALFFAFRPVVLNGAFVRGDPLALLLSAAAVVALARKVGGSWLPALLCALAVWTKQSYLAAPAASLLWLCLVDRRRAASFAAALALAGATLAVISAVAFGRGFWFSTLIAPNNPFSLRETPALLANVALQPVFSLVAVVAVASSARAIRTRAWRPGSPYPLYALASLGVLALTLPKLGASTNYFFEPMLALLLYGTHLAADRSGARLAQGRPLAATAAVVAVLALELAVARPADVSLLGKTPAADIEAAWVRLRGRVRAVAASDPRVLSLHSARPNYSVARRAALSDPYLYGLLWRGGVLSTEPIVTSLAQRHWDAILLEAGSRPRNGDDVVRGVERAVFRHYRLASAGPFYDVYVPRP